MNVIDAIIKRRSHRLLGNHRIVSDEVLEKALFDAIKHTPSSFNAQSQTAMLLLGNQHHQLWEIVLESLRKIVPETQFPKTSKKIKTFDDAYGTILFFDHLEITKNLEDKFPLYRHNIENWVEQQTGMLQSNIWLVLTELGYGASLQHYTELIEEEVKVAFNVPKAWKLIAQMPFGSLIEEPGTKDFLPMNQRFIVKK
ncbi:MAG: nitroreductase [Tenericutes bacterium HGW-Tenericutes-1]|jgi:hypothetical protein|nr:MAG: nitroreductase [Tenericutes bacterium HGW-Tenericutes-1]